MKSKRFLSVLLLLVMIINTAPISVFAVDTPQNVNVNFTAQANGEFLCAPQIGVSVSSDTAENYGFKDEITGGVSAVDALVKLHEIKYGPDFTKETASAYLAMSDDGYISKLFGTETTANGFVYNGAYPNDGTESDWGGYNGTTVTTQELSYDDTVEFFMYQDVLGWSDEIAWFNYKGNAVTEITASPNTTIKLNLKTSSYMMAYQYIDADAIHAAGSSVYGAQLAWVDAESGDIEDITSAVTDTSGDVSITAPESEGAYYLTAYIPDSMAGEPLIMSLTKIIVSTDAPQADPCALSSLSIASFESNPNALGLTPEFSSNVTDYSVPVVDFPSVDLGVFRSVYVKAAAETEEAVIIAECNGISADITSGDSTWKMLNGALTGGKNNVLKITVAASSDEDAEQKTYSVTVPMKPQTNTAPEALKETDAANITIGDTYSVDLSEIFTDADEVDTLTYKVSMNDAEAIAAEKDYTFTPSEKGVYKLVFTANDGSEDSSFYTVTLTVKANISKPTSITIDYNAENVLPDGKIVCRKGDKFKLIAYDQDGKETPVTWKNTSYGNTFTLDETTGEVEVSGDIYASASNLYFTATSTLDETISKQITIQATGFIFSEYQKSQTVSLSTDGQTAKTVSLSGGLNGCNIWSCNIPEGIAEIAADPGTGSTIQFNVFRPGTISASFKLNIDEKLTDTATITVTGVAVEDADGNNTKTYLGINTNNPNPTVQLKAFVADGRTLSTWESADETVATVDENGLVTAKGVGSTIITATDSESTKGGIKVVCESEASSCEGAQILKAELDSGDWYPCTFDKEKYTYTIVVPKDVTEKMLKYTVSEGATVKLGTIVQTAVDGVYTLPLTASQKALTITSSDGKISNTYNFRIQNKADGYPDKVTDFLCINSQHTNGEHGAAPWTSLSGNFVSIGNFGGYITYYYEDALKDNPNNKYGIDFYVYGNANKDTSSSDQTSFFEPAQAWVSEDGENWYALAGSAHYDEGVDWNYRVTYSKTASGKTSWTDSQGNSNDGMAYAGTYPLASVYNMNNLAASDTIELSGIALPARNGEIAVSGKVTDAYPVKWGYADCFANGTKGADVNPYTDNTNFDLQTNGFDLKWAVDENGNPVDVSDKEFHYVKLVTASNIWHPSYGEKSPEISGVVKTVAQSEAVGKTSAPTGVTISDGADSKTVNFTEGQNIYAVNLDNMKYVSVKVNGTADDDNIYVNNQRVVSGIAAEGFKVTKEKGETLVRVIVQNGDREPAIYLLKLTSNATESDELVESIKIDASGAIREASTMNGTDYTASVGYRISSISITPVADRNVTITVNGEELVSSYDLAYGSNTFEIAATDAYGNRQTINLTVIRNNVPVSTGNTITVKFALYGDEKHGDSETHTYKNDKSRLPLWISQKSYTVDSGATVLDVFEKALSEANLSWKNDNGNYISKINGLAEFDNGSLSGWMYLLNGTRVGFGIAEQTLKNGDIIIFHYTDDYTQEQDSEKLTSSSSGGSSVPSYTVKFETNGGNTISSQSISKNGTVAKPAEPVKEGYTFAGWYIDKKLTKEYEFSAKVTSGFTLYAKWIEGTKEPANDDEKLTAFADVEKGSWYEEAVAYAVEHNLFKGISETEFEPEGDMTRAMLVTVLYRLENLEKTEKTNIFIDVADGEWYADAVVWAAENGIVKGVIETEFAPNDSITREQMAAVLYRYAQYKQQYISMGEDTNILFLKDFAEISEYAISAVQWARGSGLIMGETDSTINPKNNATRAQVAAILMRFCENIEK